MARWPFRFHGLAQSPITTSASTEPSGRLSPHGQQYTAPIRETAAAGVAVSVWPACDPPLLMFVRLPGLREPLPTFHGRRNAGAVVSLDLYVPATVPPELLPGCDDNEKLELRPASCEPTETQDEKR